jgi:oligoendopeptidase F
MNQVQRIPARADVALTDTWDLGSLFASDQTWEAAFVELEKKIDGYAPFVGSLGDSAQRLCECLKFDSQISRAAERLGGYAMLKNSEDQANSDYVRMVGRFQNLMSRAAEAASFLRPEILAIDAARMEDYLKDPALSHFRLSLERLLRFRPHTLSKREEEMLAMQSEMAQTARATFDQLTNSDMKFGTIKDASGSEIELSNSTFIKLLMSASREVRESTFKQYYQEYAAHENSLAALLNGSVQADVFYSRVRGYPSTLESELFGDHVPVSVYDNLIAAVRKNLPSVHRYYELRKRKMNLPEIHHYDTYVPILSDITSNYSWDQAVNTVLDSLQPLGSEYVKVLEAGLRGRWCDRYPNQGKRSGAFSSGSYDGIPYILMNYNPDVLKDMFTLTHEAGHSMHTYFSAKNQPFEYYDYTIFVAEVASTFNEQLLSHHLLNTTTDKKQRAFLINNEIDDVRATIVRQTMFAEFEKVTHEMVEAGEPLTVQAIKNVYGKLLKDYFGPDFVVDDELQLECLRIPHFYRAFYVYKYATGMSAAIALSQKVLRGGATELNQYLSFLKGGSSKYPLDLLRDAGVDMQQPEPVDLALAHFDHLVAELEELLD